LHKDWKLRGPPASRKESIGKVLYRHHYQALSQRMGVRIPYPRTHSRVLKRVIMLYESPDIIAGRTSIGRELRVSLVWALKGY
jgi:hypothetical protein